MTTYRVTHRTEYEYEEDVAASHSRLHLLPRDGPAQTCVSTEIASLPPAGDYSEHTDFFGNRVGYLAIHETHRTLDITALTCPLTWVPGYGVTVAGTTIRIVRS